MRKNRLYGLEGGEPQTNAAFLPLSFFGFKKITAPQGDSDGRGNRGIDL